MTCVVRQRGAGQSWCRTTGALSQLFARRRHLSVHRCSVQSLGILLRSQLSRTVSANLQSSQHPRRHRHSLHSLNFLQRNFSDTRTCTTRH